MSAVESEEMKPRRNGNSPQWEIRPSIDECLVESAKTDFAERTFAGRGFQSLVPAAEKCACRMLNLLFSNANCVLM